MPILQNFETQLRDGGVDNVAKELLDGRIVGQFFVEETHVEGFWRNERVHKTWYGSCELRMLAPNRRAPRNDQEPQDQIRQNARRKIGSPP